MKPVFFLWFVLVLSTEFAHCQSLNLLNSGNVWRDLIRTSENFDCCTYTYSIKFSGDTVLNSMPYKKVWQAEDSTQTHWRTIGFVRELLNKGLYYKNLYGIQDEYLLYNYNLELNDTVKISDILAYKDSSFFIVSNIENVFIDGSIRKKYLLVYPEYHNFTETWIEGIGSLSGLLREGFYYCLCNRHTLLCCFHGDEQIYKNPEYDRCYYSKRRTDGLHAIQSRQFKIIQGFSNQQVILQFPDKKQRKIAVLNSSGAIVDIFDTREMEEILNISGYQSGLYLVTSTGESLKNQKFIKY